MRDPMLGSLGVVRGDSGLVLLFEGPTPLASPTVYEIRRAAGLAPRVPTAAVLVEGLDGGLWLLWSDPDEAERAIERGAAL